MKKKDGGAINDIWQQADKLYFMPFNYQLNKKQKIVISGRSKAESSELGRKPKRAIIIELRCLLFEITERQT